jgi:hypothetical protein
MPKIAFWGARGMAALFIQRHLRNGLLAIDRAGIDVSGLMADSSSPAAGWRDARG